MFRATSRFVMTMLANPVTAWGIPAQPATNCCVVTGTVVSAAGTRLAGAELTVADKRAVSDTAGSFRLSGIASGEYVVTARKVGFSPSSTRVTVGQAETPVRLTLVAVAVLDSVQVTAAAIPEFEERRLLRAGHFITRAELAKSPHKKLADELRRVPGLRMHTNQRNRDEVFAINARGAITIAGNNPTCYVHVYVDDAPVYSGGPYPYNLRAVTTDDVESVEYYAGGASIPAKYNRTGSACGVLVIWTRR